MIPYSNEVFKSVLENTIEKMIEDKTAGATILRCGVTVDQAEVVIQTILKYATDKNEEFEDFVSRLFAVTCALMTELHNSNGSINDREDPTERGSI